MTTKDFLAWHVILIQINSTVLLDLNLTYARVQKATARNIHGNACNVILVLACTLLLMNQNCQQAFNECLTNNVREHQV